MNSRFKIPVGKYTQKRRPVSPVQTFEALRPENMGIGYRQSIDKKKEEDDSKLERRKEINSLKARIDAMSPSEQDQIRKHLLELMQANNTIAEINKSREEKEEKQFRPIQRTKSVLKDLDIHDENDDIEIPSDQNGIWKTSYSKGGRGTNLHSLGRRRMRTRTRATKMRRAKKKTTKTNRKRRRNRSIKKRR